MLCENGVFKTHYIHRMMAHAFLDKNKYDRCVIFKDKDYSNLILDNIKWCDGSSGSCKLSAADVLKIRELVKKNSQAKVAKMFDVSQVTVGHIVNGKTWTRVC